MAFVVCTQLGGKKTMNELVRKLSELADDMADDKIQMQGEYHPDWHDVRDQFFVELIVNECCAALNPILRSMISRGQGVALIKERMGVE